MKNKQEKKRWPLVGHLALIMGIASLAFVAILYSALAVATGASFVSPRAVLQSARQTIAAKPDLLPSIAQTAVLALGVLTGAGAATLAYRKHRNEEEKHTRDQAADYTSRFLKAVELLGNQTDISIRTGAAYAFEQLAHESKVYRQRIVDVLCSFFRKERRREDSDPTSEEIERLISAPVRYLNGDEQAVFHVLARLNKEYDGLVINLERVDLSNINMNLDIGVFGDRNGKVKHYDSDMSLRNVVLSNSILIACQLDGVNLSGSKLTGVYLSKAQLSGADLMDADIAKAKLTGVILGCADLTRANFNQADLSGADLIFTYLMEASLMDANLTGANLRDADLSGAHLGGARFDEATLCDASLVKANLIFGSFLKAKLRRTNLQRVIFSRDDIQMGIDPVRGESGPNISGADLTDAEYNASIWNTKWDENTIFSNGQKGTSDILPSGERIKAPTPEPPDSPPSTPPEPDTAMPPV